MDLKIWDGKLQRRHSCWEGSINHEKDEKFGNIEKNTKISSPQYESELWKAIEVKNESKINVDEQQDEKKHSKEQCDIEEEDKNQEITAAITPMKIKSLCVWHVIKHL